MTERDEAVARFVHLGKAQVQALMSTGGLPPAWNVHAIHWLAEQDETAERQPEKPEEWKPTIDVASPEFEIVELSGKDNPSK